MKKIAITGAAGQIAYSLIFRIANGDLFGQGVPVSLHLLDIPDNVPSLKGIVLELEDCVLPLLKEVKIGSDPEALFEGIDYALLIGAKPRGPGMERKDLLAENGKIFVSQGKALNKVASKDVRVLVVGNPCNTNCLILMHHAKDLPRKNFHAMTRLDQNRAVFQLSKKANVPLSDVTNMTIWGNHSSTQVPDFVNAKIKGLPVLDVIQDRNWLEGEFISLIQKRGAEIIAIRGKSSMASAANAILDDMRSILFPMPETFSCCVDSTGNPYGIADDLVFSFPCRGDIEIVAGFKMDPFIAEKIALTQKELMEERDMVKGLL